MACPLFVMTSHWTALQARPCAWFRKTCYFLKRPVFLYSLEFGHSIGPAYLLWLGLNTKMHRGTCEWGKALAFIVQKLGQGDVEQVDALGKEGVHKCTLPEHVCLVFYPEPWKPCIGNLQNLTAYKRGISVLLRKSHGRVKKVRSKLRSLIAAVQQGELTSAEFLCSAPSLPSQLHFSLHRELVQSPADCNSSGACRAPTILGLVL